MKHRLLLVVACASVSIGAWAIYVSACDQNKQAQAAAAKRSVAMNGECAAHGAKVASMEGCAGHRGAAASVASLEGCAGHRGAAAKVASMEGCAGHKGASATTASMEGCAGHKSASMASLTECPHGVQGTQGVSFVTTGFAGAGSSCAKAAGTSKNGACATHGATASSAHDCDACGDMASCQERLRALNANMQVVPLKNGVMYVYTSETPGNVRSIQSAMARRTERLTAIAASGDKAKLCPECKAIRGAIASGKLVRETVNVDGGCLTLMTSSDPTTVAKLHAMAGVAVSQRIKS